MLFMGAMLGGAVCGVEQLSSPQLQGPIGAYALVGMGTLFAGILRAPMTSVFMMLEVSGNYTIILPVMISNTIAYVVSRRFQERALFDLLGRQDGTDLPSMEEEREFDVHTVEDAMRRDGRAPERRRVAHGEHRARDRCRRARLLPRRTRRWRVGRCLAAELLALASRARADSPLRSFVAPVERPYLYPDQSIEAALRALSGRPFVPVVHRANRARLEGVLALDDVLRAVAGPAPIGLNSRLVSALSSSTSSRPPGRSACARACTRPAAAHVVYVPDNPLSHVLRVFDAAVSPTCG